MLSIQEQIAAAEAAERWEAEHPENTQFSLTCGQCDHYRPSYSDITKGCCVIRRIMGYGGGDISTLEYRESGDNACHKVVVTVPF